MRAILTFIFCVCLMSTRAQTYKLDRAKQLDLKQQYHAAYELWKEAADDLEKSNTYSADIMLCCAKDAYLTERYDDAIAWFGKMRIKDIYRLNQQELFVKCLLYRNNWSVLANVLDSIVEINHDWNWKMTMEERIDFVKKYSKEQGEFQVQMMPSKNGEEEFALFPFSNDKMAYVTNAIEGDFLSPKEGRTGGNFYRVMICDAAKMDDRDEEAQVFKEIQNGKYHWGPVYFSKSGQKMFITVNEPQKSKEGLARMHQLKLRYFTKLNEGWKEEEFPWNSKEFSTGHATMDTLGRVIFASDRPGGLGGTDLYWTIWEDGHWSTPLNLGPTINSKGNEMFPFVSGSGDFYFASDGWPGLGGLDVFAMYNTSVAPENLLPPLNSSSDDFAFWINDANSKGYFSSNRVQDQDQLYSFDLPPYPVHIRIESHYCDNVPYANDTIVLQDLSNEKQLKLLTDENGVVSINGRKNGHYQFQIRKNKYSSGVIQSLKIDQPGNYVVKMQPQLSDQTIVFNIFNDKSKPIAGALVELFKQGAKKPKRKILSPENGKVSILKSELLDLDSVHISFINHSDFNWHKVKLSCEDTLEVPVQLKIFKREDFVNLDLILYDYGKYNLRPESKVELDKLVAYMKKHPGMKVELSSHTDSRSPFDFNEKLSQNRSNSCVQYIISKGIDPSLIIAKGYGEYKLKNRCKDGVPCSEAEHQENRRTELHILLNEGD